MYAPPFLIKDDPKASNDFLPKALPLSPPFLETAIQQDSYSNKICLEMFWAYEKKRDII